MSELTPLRKGGCTSYNNTIKEDIPEVRGMDIKKAGAWIPARFVLVFMLFIAVGLSYVIRADLSLTIIAMLNHTALAELTDNKNNGTITTDVCYIHNGTQDDDKPNDGLKDGEFVWDPTMSSIIQGSFFYGYTCTQLVGGRLADRFGPKWLIGSSMFLASVFTFLVPVVARYNVYLLITLRVLTGMTQDLKIYYFAIGTFAIQRLFSPMTTFMGVIFPATASFFSRWIPPQERSRHYTIVLAGTTLALVVSMPMAAALSKGSFADGWPSVFYVFGFLVAIWAFFWMFLIHNNPDEHPRISEEETKYILENLPKLEVFPVPWKRIFTSVPVWAMVMSMASGSWVFNTVMAELPTYLDQVLRYPIEQNGLINSLVYLSSTVVSVLAGVLADALRNKGWLSATAVRKLMDGIALLGSAVCFVGMALSGCNTNSVLALLFISNSILSFQPAGSTVIAIDMSPNFSGTVYGLTNTFYSIVGFLAPLASGLYTQEGPDQLRPWSYVFYTTSAIQVLGSIFFILFASADIQPWDSPNTEDSEVISITKNEEMEFGAE